MEKNTNKRKRRILTLLLILIILIILLMLRSCVNTKVVENIESEDNTQEVKQDTNNIVKEETNQEEKKEEVVIQKEEKPIKEDLCYWVNFYNENGELLQRNTYKYGSTPVYSGETPSLYDENYKCTFIGWDKELSKVYSTQAYTAVYSKTYISKTNAKKNIEVVEPQANTLTYNGQEQELIIAGSISEGSIIYKLNDGDYSISLPKAIDAGEYTVYYKVDGNNNYQEKSINVTIAKRNITLTSATADKTYDGTALSDNNVTVTGDGFVSNEGATYSVAGTQTDVGSSANVFEYTLNANTKADNYNISKVEGTLTIAKRNVTLTSATADKAYDTTALSDNNVTVTGDGFATGEGATYSVTGTQTEVGSSANVFEYTLNVNTKADNYNISKVEGTLTVNKIKVDLPTAVSDLVYNEDEQIGVELPAGAVYTLTNNKEKNAGSHTATATLTDKEHYAWNLSNPTSEDQGIDWSIEKMKDYFSAKHFWCNDEMKINPIIEIEGVEKEDLYFEYAIVLVSEYTSNENISGWSTTDTFTVLEDEISNYYYFAKCSGDENHAEEIKQASPGCFAKGTRITMADYSTKNVEDIVEGDEVLTYNHELGKYEGQKVYLAWNSSDRQNECPFTLHFTNDINVSVVGDHDFFEKESLKYVAIFESNAQSFIGKHFYNAIDQRYEELLSVTYETKAVEYYEIYTEYNANCIAESMLNVPLDTSEVLNIYKFNEDLTIDHEELTKDINEFGLYEYYENELYSKEVFDTQNWKYLNILIGKGFGTFDDYVARRDAFLNEDY